MTLDFHTIRLRGPWQLEVVARFVARPDGCFEIATVDSPESVRATMPANWSESLGPDFIGRVRYVRTFQRPTGLEPGDKVWLCVEPPRSLGIVRLANHPLGRVHGSGSAGRFEITTLLADRNRLEIVVEHPALDEEGKPADGFLSRGPGGLVGEVRLEIEPGI